MIPLVQGARTSVRAHALAGTAQHSGRLPRQRSHSRLRGDPSSLGRLPRDCRRRLSNDRRKSANERPRHRIAPKCPCCSCESSNQARRCTDDRRRGSRNDSGREWDKCTDKRFGFFFTFGFGGCVTEMLHQRIAINPPQRIDFALELALVFSFELGLPLRYPAHNRRNCLLSELPAGLGPEKASRGRADRYPFRTGESAEGAARFSADYAAGPSSERRQTSLNDLARRSKRYSS